MNEIDNPVTILPDAVSALSCQLFMIPQYWAFCQRFYAVARLVAVSIISPPFVPRALLWVILSEEASIRIFFYCLHERS